MNAVTSGDVSESRATSVAASRLPMTLSIQAMAKWELEIILSISSQESPK